MSTLKLKFFCAVTEQTKQLCTMHFQDHPSEQEIDLYGYGFDNRNQWYSFIRATINAREHVGSILRGKDTPGFIFSFAKAYAENNEINPNDHIIAEFSGYGDGTGWLYVINLRDYVKNVEVKYSNVIDDYELLMQKFNELQI